MAGSITVNKRFSVTLDISRSISNRAFTVVEGDTGNIIVVTLTDNGAAVDLTGCRVIAVFSKPDGSTASQSSGGSAGDVTIGGDGHNELTIALFASSVAPGMMECEVQIYSGEDSSTLVTSAKFNFMCRKALASSDTVEAAPEYPILLALISEADAAAASALAAANDLAIIPRTTALLKGDGAGNAAVAAAGTDYPDALKANRTVYVATGGSDTTGNGSSGTPFATVQKALDSIPKNLNGFDAVINIADGTYEQSSALRVEGFFGGALKLRGASTAGTIITAPAVTTLSINSCAARLEVSNLTISNTATSGTIYAMFYRSVAYALFTNCVINGGSMRCTTGDNMTAHFTGCTLTGTVCVWSGSGCKISLYNCVLSATSAALYARYGGTIAYNSGCTITGSTYTGDGGRVYEGAAREVAEYETGTFTPALLGGTDAGTFTPDDANHGEYTRLGDVYICTFTCAGTLTGATGTLNMSGFPEYLGEGAFGIVSAYSGLVVSALKVTSPYLTRAVALRFNNSAFAEVTASSGSTSMTGMLISKTPESVMRPPVTI